MLLHSGEVGLGREPEGKGNNRQKPAPQITLPGDDEFRMNWRVLDLLEWLAHQGAQAGEQAVRVRMAPTYSGTCQLPV